MVVSEALVVMVDMVVMLVKLVKVAMVARVQMPSQLLDSTYGFTKCFSSKLHYSAVTYST